MQNGFWPTPRGGLGGRTVTDALHGLVNGCGQQERRYFVGQQDDRGLLKTSANQRMDNLINVVSKSSFTAVLPDKTTTYCKCESDI